MLKENPPKDDKKKDDKKSDKDKKEKKGRQERRRKDNKDKENKDDKGDGERSKTKIQNPMKTEPKPAPGGISKERLEKLIDAVNKEGRWDKVNAKKVKETS
jgi:hypothetical protein